MAPPPPHKWRALLVPLGLLLPFLLLPRVTLSGDLLLTPHSLHYAYSAMLHALSFKAAQAPLWWDQSILGGYPAYALGTGGPTYPGFALLWLLPNQLQAWNLTLLLHLGAAAALIAARCNRAGTPLPLSLALMALAGGSMEAFYAINAPAMLLVIPWLIWVYSASASRERHWAIALAHWSLILAIALTIHWTAWVLGVVVIAVTAIATRRALSLLAIPLGSALAGFQLWPLGLHAIAIQPVEVTAAIPSALHLLGALLVVAMVLRGRPQLIALVVLTVGVAGLYPLAWVTYIPVAIAWAQFLGPRLKSESVATGIAWLVPVVLLASSLAARDTIALPYQGLRGVVGEARSLVPLESSPAMRVVQPTSRPLDHLSRYGRPLDPSDFTRAAAWPLLINLAPDPGAGPTRVALPWNPAWDALLRDIDTRLKPPATTQLGDLLQAEYDLAALGITLISWDQPNYPFLDFVPLDGAHRAQSEGALSSEDALRDERERELLDALAHRTPGATPLPTTAPSFEQSLVGGRAYYRSRTPAPGTVVLFDPPTPARIALDDWPGLLHEAFGRSQIEFDYPFQSLEERKRYVALRAVDQAGTIPLLIDQGFTAGNFSAITEEADGLSVEFSFNAGEASWLLLRTAWAPGWSAEVNLEPVELALAHGPYLAVPLETQELNTIVLRYRVPGLAEGIRVSLIALVVWLALGAFGLVRSGALHAEARSDREDGL